MRLLLSPVVALIWSLSVFSNNSTGLKVGDACASLVVNTSQNSIQSFVFPNSGKLTMLHFWTSSDPSSIRDFYRFSLINKKYADEDYKSANGFDMILVALQSDREAWMNTLRQYNLLDAKNGICLKGLDDFYVKNFNLSNTPTTLLVDEQGKIIAVNPNADAIINLLNEKRDYAGDDRPVTKISGQVLAGNQFFAPLANETIYVINDRKDTIQTTSTNGSGKFVLNNDNMQGITLNIHKSSRIKAEDNLVLANERGTIVSAFTKGVNEFEYRLLDLELSFLKPVSEPEVKVKSMIKDLSFSENLYEDGGYTLSAKSKAKLDVVLTKLKNYPGATVEIVSHSDCRGGSAANQILSQKRSESIAHYFISKGLSSNKIKSIGKGEEEPVNHCVDGVPCSEKELAANRRTEFRFYQSE